jgi:hypothetical protein
MLKNNNGWVIFAVVVVVLLLVLGPSIHSYFQSRYIDAEVDLVVRPAETSPGEISIEVTFQNQYTNPNPVVCLRTGDTEDCREYQQETLFFKNAGFQHSPEARKVGGRPQSPYKVNVIFLEQLGEYLSMTIYNPLGMKGEIWLSGSSITSDYVRYTEKCIDVVWVNSYVENVAYCK